MASLARFARKTTRESPRPDAVQAGSGSLPCQARRAATQAGFAVLEKKSRGCKTPALTAVVTAVDPPPRIMLVRAKWRKPRLFARLHISGQRGNGSISLHTAISEASPDSRTGADGTLLPDSV